MATEGFVESIRRQIPPVVRTAILDAYPGRFRDADRDLPWDARTDRVFGNDVQGVLLAVDRMCAAFNLPFDPHTLPAQSIFRSFPRLANFCAYLEYRLTRE